MPVLMRDVAERARVSITTVSHVLNDTRPVAENTRRRVLKALEQLSYYKNSSARLLVRGHSDLLGLLISDFENPFFPELIKSFENACTLERLEVLVCSTNYDQKQAGQAVRRMLENRVQGVAVMTSQFAPELERQLAGQKVPVVLLGPGPKRRCRSNVAIDYSTGLAEALAHLQKLGHENIAVATGPQNQVSAIEYRNTVLEEMKKRRVKPFRILEGDHRPESGARAAREILSGRQRPTALLCANDRMAIGAIGAAVDLGFRVPEDLSVIGADDIWIARYCQPPLTTVRIPRDTLGRMAFDILIGMIRAKGKMGSEHVLKTELVVRRSTGVDGRTLKEETMQREREMAGTRANA